MPKGESRESPTLVAPLCGFAIPAVLAQFRQQIVREPPDIARNNIRLDVRQLAHAWNNRADYGLTEDEAQGHLRHAEAGSLRNRFESVGALDAGNQIFRHEVNIAP